VIGDEAELILVLKGVKGQAIEYNFIIKKVAKSSRPFYI
jgi:hypothetical protein